jgi:ferredoxin
MELILEGHSQPIRVRAGETILTSLLRAGLPFPFSCQTGSCGTCKCELVSGEVTELAFSPAALTPDERGRRVILACRTLLLGDGRVRRID